MIVSGMLAVLFGFGLINDGNGMLLRTYFSAAGDVALCLIQMFTSLIVMICVCPLGIE